MADSDTTHTENVNIDTAFQHKKTMNNLTQIIKRQINEHDPYPLNIHELQNFFYYGYSTQDLRARSWQIFLNYSVKNKFKQHTFLYNRRQNYHEYKNCVNDRNDSEYYDQIIENDLTRKYIFPTYNNNNVLICEFLDSTNINGNVHRNVVKNILKSFRKTNASIGYVQGMCHLLLPIYYVFAIEQESERALYAEEDAYFCFFNLMSEVGDVFLQNMDNDRKLGVKAKMKEVFNILEMNDEMLYVHLQKIGIMESGVLLRWVTLLLTLEFEFDQCIWLWDRFLSDFRRFEILLFCCAAMLIILKDKLMAGNFGQCMEILQEKKDIDPLKMFKMADELRIKYYKVIRSSNKAS